MQDDSPLWRAWLSQHLLPTVTVAIELRLPENLIVPATVAALCDRLDCNARVLYAVLEVLAAQDLALVDDGRWRLTATGEAYLLRRSGAFAGPYLMSSAACEPCASSPVTEPLPHLELRMAVCWTRMQAARAV